MTTTERSVGGRRILVTGGAGFVGGAVTGSSMRRKE
jgi:nucleoside-diphosphate-sugar epimerase